MPRGKKKVESDTETESEDDFLNDDSSDEDSSDLDLGSDDEGSDDEGSDESGSDEEEEEDEEEEMNTQPYFSNFSLAPQTTGFGTTQFLQQPQQGQFLQQPQFLQQQQFQPQLQFQQQQSSFLAQSQNRPLQLQSQPQTSFLTQPQTSFLTQQPQTSFLTQPQQLQQPQTSFLTQPQQLQQPQTSFLTQPQQLQQPQTSFLAQPQLQQPQTSFLAQPQLQQPQTSFLTQPPQLQQPQTSFLTQPGSATPTQSQLQQAQQAGLRTPTSLLTTPLTQTFQPQQAQQPQTSFLTSQPQFQRSQTSFLTSQPGSATPTSVQAQVQAQQVQQPKPTPDLVTLLTKYDFKPYNIEFRLWNTIPKKLIIKFPKDLFNDYKKYFEAYQGEFHPDYIKEDKSSAWVFSSSRQNDLEELIKNILTRALPAPSQLAVPPAVSINMQTGLNLGSTTPSAASRIVAEPNVTPVTKSVEASQIVAAGPKTPPAPAMAPTSAPSAVVQNLNLTSTGMPNIATPQLKVPTETLISLAQRAQAQYSVLKQDLGEIEERYKRRQAYYNILLANPALNRSPQVKEYADTLSRMKVNIEFDNTKYGDHEIKVLESYLGK
mgnify:CR=1 FL=1